MHLSKRLRSILVCAAALPLLVKAQPPWSPILSELGQTNEQSGTFFQFSGLSNPPMLTTTQTATIPTYGFTTFLVPTNGVDGAETVGGYDTTCGSGTQPGYWSPAVPPYRYPSQYVTSYSGPSTGLYTGLQVYGSFQSTSVTGIGAGAFILPRVFFHEQQCFFGGREYGFFLDVAGIFQGETGLGPNTMYAYWSTNANCTPSICSGAAEGHGLVPLGQGGTGSGNLWGSPFEYEMYPTGNWDSCAFQIFVRDLQGDQELDTSVTVDYAVTQLDQSFCSAILGEHGYITAGITYDPTITSIDQVNNTGLTLYTGNSPAGGLPIWVGK